ncbi:hypothetical protein X946_5513 [Burkholderia sp. ABCPW 111]|nr:hypothetical protein X946_5513 [Burkholderia sp. ABCPW 111]
MTNNATPAALLEFRIVTVAVNERIEAAVARESRNNAGRLPSGYGARFLWGC